MRPVHTGSRGIYNVCLSVPQDPTKLSGAPLVSHLRKLYRKTDAKEAGRKPERPAVWSTTTPESLLPPHGPPYGPLPLPVFKPSKRTKVNSKSAGKTTTTRQPAVHEDLSDVSLD